MGLPKQIEQKFRDKPLILTLQLLLDFGSLQVIVWDPNKKYALGRKLASIMLKLMAMRKRFIVLMSNQKHHNGDSMWKYTINFKYNIPFSSKNLTPLTSLTTWKALEFLGFALIIL